MPSDSRAMAKQESGSSSMHSAARPDESNGTGVFMSLQPRARVARTVSSASGGAHNVVPLTRVSSATSRVLRARSTSRWHTLCNRLKGPRNLSFAALLATFAPQPSCTPSSCAATAGSEASRPESCAASSSARSVAAARSACTMASTTVAELSSFAKTDIARCRRASPTLSGCTMSDRRRKVLRMAAAPSLRSAGARPSAAKGFVARDSCSIRRSRSSTSAAKAVGRALYAERSRPRPVLTSERRLPTDSVRRRSSSQAIV
mmetsp:Transcript_17597/g.51382  ORF Transcript_17597/g.51382 Transcript_17597/m.51382 type:complete len:261 (+) Transcript_17597:54-836(+)